MQTCRKCYAPAQMIYWNIVRHDSQKTKRYLTMNFNPFMPSGLFYLNFLDQSISSLRGVLSVLIISMFKEMPVVNANSVDPDQTPRSAASDLGQHCLPMSHLWDARHKWVNRRDTIPVQRNLIWKYLPHFTLAEEVLVKEHTCSVSFKSTLNFKIFKY